jgi:hypothetical protein
MNIDEGRDEGGTAENDRFPAPNRRPNARYLKRNSTCVQV